jgi:NAD(P)-dependent dehydrogenase (short-subunit alcohol dehydrogenase family)
MSVFHLVGRFALITGTGRGIGADAARLLAIGGAPASVRRRDDVRARAEAHR